MTTTTDVGSIPAITREEAHRLAASEYERLVAQLRPLSPDDWAAATDCPAWNVRDMAGHSVGMMLDFTSFRTLLRRMRLASKASKRTGAPMVDSMTAQQVAEHAALSTDDLVALAESVGPRAARWRTGAPKPFRSMKMHEEVGGTPETWRMGYLLDTILTRDPWMHRVDIARATSRPLELTPDHDGRIVADVVAEWARRHGQPFTLVLGGPAGGEFIAGDGGELIELDAIEFCRILSGRATGTGLLAQEVPF